MSKIRLLTLILVAFVLLLPSLTKADLTNGLVAYWSFDNCDATDDSGNGHNGTIYGTPQCVDGEKGKAFNFDGTGNYIAAPSPGIPNNSSFTVSYWMKFEWQVHRIWTLYFSNFHALINSDSQYGYSKGIVQYGIFDGTQNQFDIEQYQGAWTHVTTIYDADAATLTTYVNATPTDSKPHSGGTIEYNTDLYIGQPHPFWSGDSYYKGDLDEVRIYNRALTGAEIQELYGGGGGFSGYLPTMPAATGNFGTVISASPSFADGYHWDDPSTSTIDERDIPEHYTMPSPMSGYTAGDALDYHWVWVGNWYDYVIWDFNDPVGGVRVYPSQDHGPYVGGEFDEYDVWGSNDQIDWTQATEIALYYDDINNIRTHDGVKDFKFNNAVRYIKIRAVNDSDYEIDAVEALSPNLEVSPSSYDFGEVELGASRPQPFTLKNIGSTDLEISGIALSDTENFKLSIDALSCKRTLTSGESCTFDIYFWPSMTGNLDANLIITSNDPDTPTFELQIVGVANPMIKFSDPQPLPDSVIKQEMNPLKILSQAALIKAAINRGSTKQLNWLQTYLAKWNLNPITHSVVVCSKGSEIDWTKLKVIINGDDVTSDALTLQYPSSPECDSKGKIILQSYWINEDVDIKVIAYTEDGTVDHYEWNFTVETKWLWPMMKDTAISALLGPLDKVVEIIEGLFLPIRGTPD